MQKINAKLEGHRKSTPLDKAITLFPSFKVLDPLQNLMSSSFFPKRHKIKGAGKKITASITCIDPCLSFYFCRDIKNNKLAKKELPLQNLYLCLQH